MSRLRLQSKSHRRGFTSYKASPRQLGEDRKNVLQSCPLPATPDEGGKVTTLTGLFTPVNGAAGRLAGKSVIITGASRGIGAAIAERFAFEGARCVLLGRNVEALTHVKEGLIGPSKADHVVKAGDVGNLVFWKDVVKSEVSV
jgi:short chain dehydrogenase